MFTILQEEGWVVCRAFKKRATSQTKNMETWDSTYFYDEPSTVTSVVDPLQLDHIKRQHPSSFLNQNFMCKQEVEAENLIYAQSDHHFVQLPQLQSPSLPSLKRPTSSVSLMSENNEEEQHISKRCKNDGTNKMTTDWRDLDKFVASQLSQEEERCDQGGGYGNLSSFGGHESYSSDMALLLLQSGSDEDGNKLNELLNSDSSCDIGICIFDK